MDISFSAAMFVVGGLLLLVFAVRHLREYFRDSSNVVNSYYAISSLSVSLALIIYGLPGVLGLGNGAISLGGSIATIVNVFGFGSLLFIPIYSWFGKGPAYIVAGYCVRLFILLLAMALIILPPQSFVDPAGAIHWRFHPITSFPALIFMIISFGLNGVLIIRNWQRLTDVSPFNVFAILFTFAVTGLSGSYLYIGDDSLLLLISSVLMPIGLATVFFSALKGFVGKKS